MEEKPGIHLGHFDLVISIYTLEWRPSTCRERWARRSVPETKRSFCVQLGTSGLLLSWLKVGNQFVVKNAYQHEGPDLGESLEVVLHWFCSAANWRLTSTALS